MGTSSWDGLPVIWSDLVIGHSYCGLVSFMTAEIGWLCFGNRDGTVRLGLTTVVEDPASVLCFTVSDDEERWKGGGERTVANGRLSETAEAAKSSSSSSCSMTSSGILSGGNWAVWLGKRRGLWLPSRRIRESEVGEMSLGRAPSLSDDIWRPERACGEGTVITLS